MRFLVLSGPNLNMLGVREPELYGRETYKDLMAFVQSVCDKHGIEVEFYQSNHEGRLIDVIQATGRKYDGMIFNPGAYTHTSIAIGDALKCITTPVVELHLTDVTKREAFRQISYVRDACIGTVMGEGFKGYETAVNMLLEHLNK